MEFPTTESLLQLLIMLVVRLDAFGCTSPRLRHFRCLCPWFTEAPMPKWWLRKQRNLATSCAAELLCRTACHKSSRSFFTERLSAVAPWIRSTWARSHQSRWWSSAWLQPARAAVSTTHYANSSSREALSLSVSSLHAAAFRHVPLFVFWSTALLSMSGSSPGEFCGNGRNLFAKLQEP